MAPGVDAGQLSTPSVHLVNLLAVLTMDRTGLRIARVRGHWRAGQLMNVHKWGFQAFSRSGPRAGKKVGRGVTGDHRRTSL